MGQMWDWGLPYSKEGRQESYVPERGGRSYERPSAPPPQREARGGGGWAQEEKGIWDFTAPGEEIDPKIDQLVWNWVKKNPHNIVDILTGMYGLASRNASAQERIRKALDASREVLEVYPARTAADEIGRRIEDFAGTEKNYQNFKQALLLALPKLIREEKGRRANDRADALIYVGDRIYEL